VSGAGIAIQAVIFDLDGTLTEPFLDFDAIRREIRGIDGPVLEGLRRLDGGERQRAEAILARHEHEAAVQSRLQPRACEVIRALRGAGVKTAVLTRNSRLALEVVFSKYGLEVDAVRTREDGPCKPAPEPVLVVGDYLFDLQAANAAGAVSVLFWNGGNEKFAGEARHVVRGLDEVLGLVEGLEA
jgi:phosphoglycolate phosphatase-like HAD superfamily hydrolase